MTPTQSPVTRPSECPRCGSPDPKRHSAVQWEGEVQICPDPWHSPINEPGPDSEADYNGLVNQLCETGEAFNWRLGLKAADAITRLRASVERLRQWVDDLQSGMYVNCVYCGHRYGPGETTPVTMADALKEHIEQCSEHPMSKLRARVAELEEENSILEKANCARSSDDGWEVVGEAEWETGHSPPELRLTRTYRRRPTPRTEAKAEANEPLCLCDDGWEEVNVLPKDLVVGDEVKTVTVQIVRDIACNGGQYYVPIETRQRFIRRRPTLCTEEG